MDRMIGCLNWASGKKSETFIYGPRIIYICRYEISIYNAPWMSIQDHKDSCQQEDQNKVKYLKTKRSYDFQPSSKKLLSVNTHYWLSRRGKIGYIPNIWHNMHKVVALKI